ncbi:MAG: tautomerase family protein [Aureispira sp.]
MTTRNKNSYQAKRELEKKQKKAAKLAREIEEKTAVKSFVESWYVVYQSSKFFKWLLQLASGVTAICALYYLLPHFYLILKIPLIMAGIIGFEIYVKRPIVHNFFRDYCVNEYDLEPFTATSALIAVALSVSLSVYGSTKMVYLLFPDVEEGQPVLLVADEINATYNKRFADIMADQKKFYKSRSHYGKLRKEDSKIVSTYANDKRRIDSFKREALLIMADSNKVLTAAHAANYEQQQTVLQKQREEWQYGFIVGVVILELLYFLCVFFGFYYVMEAKDERETPRNTTTSRVDMQDLITLSEGLTEQQKRELVKGIGVNVNASSRVLGTSVAPRSIQITQGNQETSIPKVVKKSQKNAKKTTNCAYCNKEFVPTRKGHLYCSTECKSSNWRAKQQ